MSTVSQVFRRCVLAIGEGRLIERTSTTDKEFHFQNWFRARLQELPPPFEVGGRNSYPDFRMVETAEGYEIKGLAYPGRYADFDSNSQVPTGWHNGRTIYYVFGRYPKEPDGNSYPVIDLAVCHGDLLNADHDYAHVNRNVRGFGSYGDILIRDRKMYVAPTPYRLMEGVAHHHTLILPADVDLGPGFFEVGFIRRTEAAEVLVGYSFDLQTGEIGISTMPNPDAGREHCFRAWRLEGAPADTVRMRDPSEQPTDNQWNEEDDP